MVNSMFQIFFLLIVENTLHQSSLPPVEHREHLLSPFYAQLQDMNSSDWYKGVESNTKKKDAVPSELLAPYYEVCIFDEYDIRLTGLILIINSILIKYLNIFVLPRHQQP